MEPTMSENIEPTVEQANAEQAAKSAEPLNARDDALRWLGQALTDAGQALPLAAREAYYGEARKHLRVLQVMAGG
jgi:hypothetical protein